MKQHEWQFCFSVLGYLKLWMYSSTCVFRFKKRIRPLFTFSLKAMSENTSEEPHRTARKPGAMEIHSPSEIIDYTTLMISRHFALAFNYYCSLQITFIIPLYIIHNG